FFFFQAEDGIRDRTVTGVQTCALPIYRRWRRPRVTRVNVRERVRIGPDLHLGGVILRRRLPRERRGRARIRVARLAHRRGAAEEIGRASGRERGWRGGGAGGGDEDSGW